MIDERRERRMTRREFLGVTGKASLLAGLGGLTTFAKSAAGARTGIAIVGGGLAGLTCAWRLKQAGFSATIYEAAGDLGGRCRTRRQYFDEGQVAERGGELIDTGHFALRRLAHEFGLVLDDLLAAEPPGTEPFYFFQGNAYSFDEATRDFREIDPTLRADLRAAGYPTLYNHYTPRGRELDRTSIVDYLNEIVPGGVRVAAGAVAGCCLQYRVRLGDHGAKRAESSLSSRLFIEPGVADLRRIG